MNPLRRLRLLPVSILALLLSFLPLLICAAIVVVDDQFGDPITGAQIAYEPASAWDQGQNCPKCTSHPDRGSVYRGTWMNSSANKNNSDGYTVGQPVNATLSFTGISVSVQVVIRADSSTDLTFVLDGQVEGGMKRAAQGKESYQYNQTVFSKEGLGNNSHVLVIQSGNSGQRSLMLLDSVMYTTANDVGTSSALPSLSSIDISSETSTITSVPSPSSKPTSSANVAIIIGPTVGGIVLLAIVALLLYRRTRRHHRAEDPAMISKTTPMPFVVDTTDRQFALPSMYVESMTPSGSAATGKAELYRPAGLLPEGYTRREEVLGYDPPPVYKYK